MSIFYSSYLLIFNTYVYVISCFRVSVLAVAFLHNHAGHALDAVGSVVLIVSLPGHVLQVLHVRANEHVPQLHEVTMCRVLHCKARRDHEFQQCVYSAHDSTTCGTGLGEGAYPPRCPRGRDGLVPSSLWPPPLCCCQLLQRGCFPCWENRNDHKIKAVFGRVEMS